MSVVERALANLKKTAGGVRPPQQQPSGPIARIASADAPKTAGNLVPVWQREHSPSDRKLEFNLEALRRAGLYAVGNQRLIDEYRIIKRPLLKTASKGDGLNQRRANLAMVTSALAGEGKTFTSVNLSMSIASEKDWQVMLVDVDCRSPQLSRMLGVAGEPGLLDYLRESARSLDSVVLKTNIENLWVLPLGTPGGDAAELLGSSRMSELCQALSADETPGQFILFDSSPLLLTTESVVLSGQAGQAVVVVHALKTPREAVVEAVAKLDPALAIGVVLNRLDREDQGLRYGVYGQYPYPASE